MDQLRTALKWLKQQHFWVLSVLAALIGLGCWWVVSGKMSALYETSQKTITAEFTSLATLSSAPFHPNETINGRQLAETKKIADNVTKLWEQLYDRQREQVLQWPAALSKAFRDFVEKKQFGDEIDAELRNNYQNYIERHFPELPKQIGARVMEVGAIGTLGGGRGGIGPEGGPASGLAPDGTLQEDDDYICEWVDQNVIREELDFPQRPSALRIWVTQEDLWVYHTLLDVIAKTNQAAGATRQSNAAVRTVYSLEVGKRAAPFSRQQNRLLVPPLIQSPAAGAEIGPEGGPVPLGPEGGPRPPQTEMFGPEGRGGGGPGGGAGMTPEQESGFLLSYRYLDDKGMPIPFGSGAAAAAGPEAGLVPDPAAVAVPAGPIDFSILGVGYKRLPVRMVLQMDVRWLPQLISACANQPLRVEVQEVRINTPDVAGLEAGGAGGGGGFRGVGERGPGGGGAGANLFPDHTGLQNFPQQPNVVNVVIQGTIYIFNKPNPTLLQPPAEQPVAGI